jgi:hypothetical protein
MKMLNSIKKILFYISFFVWLIFNSTVYAQNSDIPASSSDYLIVQPDADRNVFFSINDPGESKPIIWGLDLAWLSEQNLRRGIAFMGVDRIDVVRSSFMPTDEIVNGELTGEALTNTNYRIQLINRWLESNTLVVLNSDHPSVNSWYKSGNTTIPSRWAEMIDITARYHQEAGRTIVTISPFNEPDYSVTGQGTIQDFYNIAAEIRKNWSRFDDVRISGGNTLNPDVAKEWFDYLKVNLDEGNTHQLAGSFDNYAAFFEHVRASGAHASNDELHNTMEAMVGVEYGLQTGIWWGTADYTRSEFVKASDGVRLAYAEHRPNWTAASVYRTLEGKVLAFGGTSERQAITTSYKYISRDRPVYFDGHGPYNEFVLELPGAPGPGYYQDPNWHSNAERVIGITWGDDIQPVIDGTYKIVNRSSGMVIDANNLSAGAIITQNDDGSGSTQHWDVYPVESRIGGDFSYYHIKPSHNHELTVDLINYSLDEGASVQLWNSNNTGNQQWFLDYVEDGWFYIRSRESSYSLEVSNGSTNSGASITQAKPDLGFNQQWRFVPVDAAIEFDKPFTNSSLEVTEQSESILLEWAANPELDIKGYSIYRSEMPEGDYSTIARDVTTTAFVDNTVTAGKTYYYRMKAVDHSLNRSNYSNEVSAEASGDNDLVLNYDFDEKLKDSSPQLHHSVSSGVISYEKGKTGSHAIIFSGNDQFLRLPATVVDYPELTITCWVKWSGGDANQMIFDFGNGLEQRMFLTPNSTSVGLRFIVVNGSSQNVIADPLPVDEWTHLAIVLTELGAWLYVNGEEVTVKLVSNNPTQFKPIINYLAKSHDPTDPLFNGRLDDFRIYNYALEANEIAGLPGLAPELGSSVRASQEQMVWPNPASSTFNLDNIIPGSQIQLFNVNGEIIYTDEAKSSSLEVDIVNYTPGVYIVHISNDSKMEVRKLIIGNH